MNKNKRRVQNINSDNILKNIRLSIPAEAEYPEKEDEVWSRIEQNIEKHKKDQTRTSIRRWKYSAVAAAVLCLLSVGMQLFQRQDKPTLEFVSNNTNGNLTYILPDQSSVVLRPNAQLSYVKEQKGSRSITFVGEGFFNVTTNKEIPFIVKTNTGEVTVLGTQFNLRANASEGISEVVLAEGRVRYTNLANEQVELTPNERLIVDASTQSMVKTTVDAQFYSGWKDEYLQFNDETLLDIMTNIARIHHVSIQIEDPKLATTKFSGKLNNLYSIEKILKDIELITPIKYTLKNNVYYIYAL